MWQNILRQALPLTLAQMVQLLYSVVDRIYIGHLPGVGNEALTGVGVTFPIVTLILAFTYLLGIGGVPLFSMERGRQDEEKAGRIMGNSFVLLFFCSFFLMAVCYLLRRPVLYLFGASDISYAYADRYLKIYLLGTPFSMLSTGMNGYINAQGFPRTGMTTILLGAMLNLILDPIFMFGFGWGVRGAALATVLSQAASAMWVLLFLFGRKSILPMRKRYLKLAGELVRGIVAMGTTGFIMQGTNCLVQVVCNATLQRYGGDLYVGIMTVLNSVREVLQLPISGIAGGAQPVLGYNYGAGERERVKAGIRFTAFLGILYTVIIWLIIMIIPRQIFQIFSGDEAILMLGPKMLRVYFGGFVFMTLQFSGQSTFQALGHAGKAIFFALFRKAVIVVPLTFLLPALGFGVLGVFLAEPVSNLIGGAASFITMYFTVYRKL